MIIKTDLTLDDLALVRVGSAMMSWYGETVDVIVVSDPPNANLFDPPPNTKATVYLCALGLYGNQLNEVVKELGGIDCSSFYTPKIKEFLKRRMAIIPAITEEERNQINEYFAAIVKDI